MTKKIIIGILFVLIAIQLIRIDKTNPPVDPSKDFITMTHPPKDVELILKNACYDCHSNTTIYPWYSNVAPVSWLLRKDIKDGRRHLNFSEWSNYPLKKQIKKLDECYAEVNEGEMPLQIYTITHSNAVLSISQRKTLETWFKSINPSKE